MALSGEVIDLVGLNILQQTDQVGCVGHIPVMQEEPGLALMRIDINVIDASSVEGRRPPLDAVNDIALIEQEPGQQSPILPGHSCDQRDLFGHSKVSAIRASNVRPGHAIRRVDEDEHSDL